MHAQSDSGPVIKQASPYETHINDCLMFQIGVSDVCMVGTDIIVH